MIKIKILNPVEDRNEPTFRPLFFIKDMLRDYSIDITESDDFDFMFIGMNEFIDKDVSLDESIDRGLENLSKITGDYFLFDGSDSTSLMGAYEVLDESEAIYLFKNQLLNREEYKKPTTLNKWFFGTDSDLDISYDTSDRNWNRIKLSGWNLGYMLPQYRDFQPISNNKNLDVCAIYKAELPYNEEHKLRNDLYYTNHRKSAWDILDNKFSSKKDKLPYQEYINTLYNSKVALSPFGMGEICFRDFECMQFGTIIVKPDVSRLDTIPNIYEDDETYIAVNYDWSDLNEKIDYVLSDFNNLNQKINTNIRNMFLEKYTYKNLCMHWYEIFSNLNEVSEYA